MLTLTWHIDQHYLQITQHRDVSYVSVHTGCWLNPIDFLTPHSLSLSHSGSVDVVRVDGKISILTLHNSCFNIDKRVRTQPNTGRDFGVAMALSCVC